MAASVAVTTMASIVTLIEGLAVEGTESAVVVLSLVSSGIALSSRVMVMLMLMLGTGRLVRGTLRSARNARGTLNAARYVRGTILRAARLVRGTLRAVRLVLGALRAVRFALRTVRVLARLGMAALVVVTGGVITVCWFLNPTVLNWLWLLKVVISMIMARSMLFPWVGNWCLILWCGL